MRMSLGISREERRHVEGCPLAHVENYLASCACGMTDSREERVANLVSDILEVLTDNEVLEPDPPHGNALLGERLFETIMAALGLSPDVSRESELRRAGNAVLKAREDVALYGRSATGPVLAKLRSDANAAFDELRAALADPPKATTEGEKRWPHSGAA
jgi:hypothetical protein